MENDQELEWLAAQKIAISVDLLGAAKQQLQFLAAVDKNRWLYEGATLEHAIYRYNACWLPLLAKHCNSPFFEGPLVVPLDCEWVWHCHRLNPVRYKTDCEELYGRILDNSNVVSSVKGVCKEQTEEIWKRLYPDEPYVFDLMRSLSAPANEKPLAPEKCTKYDLVSAVKRQSPFYYQVCRPHINNDVFIEEAVARYKGFLYLIKKNREQSVPRFCVPTYDIDLIWHTHQLHPISYCKDLRDALGKILEHDDMDSNRSKGKKLDVGFSGTTKQWEETFGSRYWKAGAMYKGSAPSPVTTIPFQPHNLRNDIVASNGFQKMIQLPDVKIVEVLLEIVGVKNLPEGHKGSLFVTFSKNQPDVFFNVKRKLTILSESEEKQVASFQCEPKGEMLFELVSHSPSNLLLNKASKTLGTASLSLQDILNPVSKLAVEKWVELQPCSGCSKPICIRIAVSFTVPIQALRVLHMVRPRSLSKSSCFFPLPGRTQHAKNWTHITDENDNEIISLQMRDSMKSKVNDQSILKKKVIGAIKSGETQTLAEFMGTQWSLMDSQWCLQLKTKSDNDSHLFQLMGSRMIKVFQGRKLEFEPKHFEKQSNEENFFTAVEFSVVDPYGKAVALFDLKSGLVKVKEEWLVLPAIISAFILNDIKKTEGYGSLIVAGESVKDLDGTVENVSGFHDEAGNIKQPAAESKIEVSASATKSGGCGSGCGSGCGNMVKSGGCGSSCGGGCGHMVKSGGCGGGGCGGGCGNMVKSGGCGGGCGSSGCGGCGGGSMWKSGGCGSRGIGNTTEGGGCSGCGGGNGEQTHESDEGNLPNESCPKGTRTITTMSERVVA